MRVGGVIQLTPPRVPDFDGDKLDRFRRVRFFIFILLFTKLKPNEQTSFLEFPDSIKSLGKLKRKSKSDGLTQFGFATLM